MLSSRAEIERIRNSLIVTAEVLAAQLLIDVAQASPIKLAHLAIRLPAVITRLRRLIVACETMLDRIATTESRLLAGMALEIGMASGLVINPPVQVTQSGKGTTTTAPKSIAAIAQRLSLLEGTSKIRIEKYSNGVVAYIPGTSSASFGWSGNPMDMKTNLQEISGRRSNVELGLARALKVAGVTPNDRLMLVGHSQGGLVAISAADKSGAFPYKIEKVITFGSPVGANFPNHLPKVLSVENKSDLVPILDGKGNPKAANWVTIEGEIKGNPIQAHLMQSYREISEEIDLSGRGTEFADFVSGTGEVVSFELSQGSDLRG